MQVALVSEQRRAASTHYRYTIGTAERQYPVLVKVRESNVDEPMVIDDTLTRPRMVQRLQVGSFQLEYNALTSIDQFFTGMHDPRFGAIHVLDCLPEYAAVVMVEARDPDLRGLFSTTNRLQSWHTGDRVLKVFNNVGAWLRAYQMLPDQGKAKTRHHRRVDYVNNVAMFANFVAMRSGDSDLIDRVRQTAEQAASHLPDELPVGLGHGDFSMRNILVGADNQVTVIDTMARWQVPIYEDLSYFLAGLWTNKPQVFTLGLAFSNGWIARCEQAFLNGYFGSDPIPYREINLFKLLALLDKWSSLVELLKTPKAGRRMVQDRIRLFLSNRHFKLTLRDMLQAVEKEF